MIITRLFAAVTAKCRVMRVWEQFPSSACKPACGLEAEHGRWLTSYQHMQIGKDRTGLIAALILAICGATDDEIVSDYARSDSPDGIALGGLEKMKELEGAHEPCPAAIGCCLPPATACASGGLGHAKICQDVDAQDWITSSLSRHRLAQWQPSWSI